MARKEGNREGRREVIFNLREAIFSGGDAQSNWRENPESDKPGQQEGGDTEKAKAAKRSLKTENGSELSVKR